MNMNECKEGDKLILRSGDIGIYVGKRNKLVYRHLISDNRILRSVDNEGFGLTGLECTYDVMWRKANA